MRTFLLSPSASRRALALAGGLMASFLVGCGDDPKQRVALLEQENQELRGRNSQLESQLNEANAQRALLEDERANLESRLGAPGTSGATGFEGIEGVDATNLVGGGVKLNVSGDILFDSGRVTLRNEAKRTLDSIASVLKSQYGGRMLRIEGHTDSDPIRKSGWKTNERLGAERALAVEEYLISKGIPNDSMYIASFGPSRPKGTKKDSRRVEILIGN
ncbi:MAG: OmpA family protein [Phycisphaerales bacterium]|nr:OmpA family protein [Phycisphaerales bacterium]